MDRHGDHRDEAIRRCLDRCAAAVGPGSSDPLENRCQTQCYPYLVDTDQIREEVELRRDEEPGGDPLAPEPEREEPLAPIPAPEPEYETERLD